LSLSFRAQTLSPMSHGRLISHRLRKKNSCPLSGLFFRDSVLQSRLYAAFTLVWLRKPFFPFHDVSPTLFATKDLPSHPNIAPSLPPASRSLYRILSPARISILLLHLGEFCSFFPSRYGSPPVLLTPHLYYPPLIQSLKSFAVLSSHRSNFFQGAPALDPR